MTDHHGMTTSIDQMHRLFADVLLPSLHDERAAIEQLLDHARGDRDAIRAHLDSAFEQLDPPLQALEQALTAIEEHAAGIGVALSSTLTDVKSRVDVLEAAFNEQVEAAGASFQTLAEAVLAGDHSSANALELMRQTLADIQHEISEQMQRVDQGTVATEAQLKDVASTIADRLAAVESTLTTFDHDCAQSLASLGDSVEERSRDVGSDLRGMLADAGDAVSNLRQSSERVFDDLRVAGDAFDQVFGSHSQDVLKDVQQLLNLVEQIKPLLEIIEEWG